MAEWTINTALWNQLCTPAYCELWVHESRLRPNKPFFSRLSLAVPAKLNFFKTPASVRLVSSRYVSTSTGILGCFQVLPPWLRCIPYSAGVFTLFQRPDSEPTKLLHHPQTKWPVKTDVIKGLVSLKFLRPWHTHSDLLNKDISELKYIEGGLKTKWPVYHYQPKEY